jgi:hypothetical protein
MRHRSRRDRAEMGLSNKGDANSRKFNPAWSQAPVGGRARWRSRCQRALCRAWSVGGDRRLRRRCRRFDVHYPVPTVMPMSRRGLLGCTQTLSLKCAGLRSALPARRGAPHSAGLVPRTSWRGRRSAVSDRAGGAVADGNWQLGAVREPPWARRRRQGMDG